MRKTVKNLGMLAMTGMLILSQGTCAFAAKGTAGSGKSVLSSYNAELSAQRSSLSELIAESKTLTASIKEAQKNAKQNGLITQSSSDQLAELSQEIKALRQSLTTERGSNKTLRAAAKEARQADDYDAAKDKLTELQEVQQKQIDIRTELSSLLQKKLRYLSSLKKTEETAITDDTALEKAFDDGAELDPELTEEASQTTENTAAAESITEAEAENAEAVSTTEAETEAENAEAMSTTGAETDAENAEAVSTTEAETDAENAEAVEEAAEQ